MGFEMLYPYVLLLLLPAAILIYLFHSSAKIRKGAEKNTVAVLRSIIFALLIFALTAPQLLLPIKGNTVIFLLDRSASMKGSDDRMLEFIDSSLASKISDDQYAILSMAKETTVEQGLSKAKEGLAELSAVEENGDTNIEQGIQLASSLIPKNQGGRIVLLSDGNETAGNASDMAKLLKEQGIILDFAAMEGKAGDDLALADFSVPSSLYKGEHARLQMMVTSNTEKNAVIRIALNNREIIKKQVHVKEGQNLFAFEHEVQSTGLFIYQADISANGDTYAENNTLYGVSNVKGTPRVLVVQRSKAPSVLPTLLSSSGLLVDSVSPEQLPENASGYLGYQSIIFDNVQGTAIGERKMKLIETAVKDFGTGFIMAGGEESFGLGGYFKTPIERLLPVNMEIKGKKETPSLGLVIVLDTSGSMSGGKLEMAKEAAARSVELLQIGDTLGFIAFDDKPWEIIKTAPLKNKKKAAEMIRSVSDGGGTDILPALQLAYEELEPLELQRKHIILLTDGQSPVAGIDDVVDNGKSANITLSTVGLGMDADMNLLEELAELGTGRFYEVVDDTAIPSILSRETAIATRTYIEDKPFFPSVKAYPEWMKLFEAGVPKMNAYIATTPKTSARTVLESEKKDPVLAEWQYGLGRTAAFTSDTKGKWAGDWARWNQWQDFWNQLVTRTFPSYESDPFHVEVERALGQAKVMLTSASKDLLPIEAAVVAQDGEEIGVNTKLVGPGKYEITMEDRPGLYFLRIKQTGEKGNSKLYQSGFTVPYSEEYLLKGANKRFLTELSAQTGGGKAESKTVFSKKLPVSYTKQSISAWLLLAAFLLFFVEIAIRRFGLGPILLFAKRLKPARTEPVVKRTETFGRLNASKGRAEKPAAEIKQKVPEQQTIKKPKKAPPVQERKEESPDRSENMKRLLEAKKRKK